MIGMSFSSCEADVRTEGTYRSSSSLTHNMDGSWDSTSTCKFGTGAERTTHGHITGDANSKVTMVLTTGGSTTPEMTMTMTWLGACKPGMKGGDVIMSKSAISEDLLGSYVLVQRKRLPMSTGMPHK